MNHPESSKPSRGPGRIKSYRKFIRKQRREQNRQNKLDRRVARVLARLNGERPMVDYREVRIPPRAFDLRGNKTIE